MYLKKKFSNMHFIAIALCMVLMMPLFSASIAWAAAKPIVKDAQNVILHDQGYLFIDSDFEVFVDPQDGAALYYALNNANINGVALTGYYDGAEGNPRGSHFEAPFTPGAVALTITDPIGNGILVGSDRKITIKNPTETVVLYVWAVANGVASPMFSYTFSPMLIVKDAEGNLFANGGQTIANESMDLFLTGGPTGAELRYAFNTNIVEAYYNGADGNPRGSYFDGPLVNGALSAVRFISIPVSADGKITVPNPAVNGAQDLKIAAIVNGSEVLVFEHIFAASEYTVAFVDWDGTVLDEQVIPYGAGAAAPKDPERVGYTFIGWDVDFSNVSEDLKVTAQYEINQYTVTFVDWNDTVLSEQIVAHGGLAIAPTPVRNGYILNGWLLDGEAFDLAGTITEEITLVADWELIPVTALRIDSLSIATVARYNTYNFRVILNEGAIDINVVWTIADPSLGYVDANGTVTIFDKTGNVRLTATDTLSNISHSITLRIAS